MKQKIDGKKHILVVSQYFYPEQFRVNDICKEWIDRGYKVTVVTGIPNYPKGKFFKGYGWLKKRKENWNGIDIIRLPIISRGNGKLRLIINYFSFVFSGFFWRLFSRIKPDCVFIYEVSPILQASIGTKFARKRKIPCSLYVLDLWPETVQIMLNKESGFMINYIEKTVRNIYKGCDNIFIPSERYRASIAKRCDNPNKIIYWPQYAEDFYCKKATPKNCLDYKVRKEGKLNLIFAGNIGYAQGLWVLLDCAKRFKDNGICDINFILLGDGRYKQTLIEEMKNSELEEYFTLHDQVPTEDVADYIAEADATLITLSKSKIFSLTIPAKLQSCLACGKPVIVCADGEIQNIIKESNCGFFVDAEDAEGLYNSILKMRELSAKDLEKMSENSLTYCKQHFDKKTLMNEMDKYLGGN